MRPGGGAFVRCNRQFGAFTGCKLFRACRKHRRELVYPGWYRPVIWFARHFPGVVERANRRIWRLK